MQQRGILMFIAGHPNYGKMAAGLAATIKVMENDIPIALLWHGKALDYLSDKEKELFDQLILLDDRYVFNRDGTFNPIKARLHFYELTPFHETLAIDVDNAWLNQKKPSEVFDELQKIPFTIQNAGHTICDENADQYFSVWADIQTVIRGYKIEGKRFYKTFGEWIYFQKRNKQAKRVFYRAKKIFLAKPKVDVKHFIGQDITDELAFSLAMAQTGIYPHQESYHPTTYFHIVSKGKLRYAFAYQLAHLYFTISMGGSINPPFTITNYNVLIESAYQKLKLQKPFKWQQKRGFLAERKTA